MSAVHAALGLNDANQAVIEQGKILTPQVHYRLSNKLAQECAALAETLDPTNQTLLRGSIQALSLILNDHAEATAASESEN